MDNLAYNYRTYFPFIGAYNQRKRLNLWSVEGRPFLEADVHTIYASDFFRVLDFKCRCTDCSKSKPEYSNNFTVAFIRKGNFQFNVFRRSLDAHPGRMLISKPYNERTVTHVHTVPDECTVFDFKDAFYREILEQHGGTGFFLDPDWHSTLIKTTVETEFLHFTLVQLLAKCESSRLRVDQLVLDIIDLVLAELKEGVAPFVMDTRLKENHLSTIEQAKDYISTNFTRDISLGELAEYCHVSPFHFSRIVKMFTATSPYKFLKSVRLKYAARLLRDTTLPVSGIAFSSGFCSLDYFTAAFHKVYKCAPSAFRVAKGALIKGFPS